MLLSAFVFPLEGSEYPKPKDVQGFFYNLINDHDPDLHDSNSLKPVTMGAGGKERKFLRFTCIDNGLTAKLSPQLYGLEKSTIRLGNHSYRVKAVLKEDHTWAGTTTWTRLFQITSSPQVSMTFASPTLFMRSGIKYPLPEPELVFLSLINRWNAFAPIKVPEKIQEALKRRTTVRYLNLQTKTVTTHEPLTGFIGRVTFFLPEASEDEQHWLSVLARFAFYGGVGARTTFGLGRVKPYIRRQKDSLTEDH